MEEFMPNSKKDINQQLRDTIYKKVTAENYQENQDETSKECKRLFKQGANPKTLAELEEILRERQDEQAIAKHLELSKPGTSPEALAKLKKSVEEGREHYNNYTQHFLPALKAEIMQSKKLTTTKKTEIEKIIMELKISDDLSKISGKDHPSSTIQNQNDRGNSQNTSLSVETSKLSSDSGSDSGVSSREPSEENLELSVNSRRSSVNSIPSVAEENNNLQKENENQMQPEQVAPEEPKMQENENSGGQADPNQVKNEVSPGVIQVADIGIQREKNTDPSGQAAQMIGSQVKNPMQPKEKKDRKKATTTVQKLPVNEKKGEDTSLKQPNNRNLHVALIAGCALSTIGCIVAGAMTSGLVGAGLLAMAAVFAIAAVAELHSNFLSSKLTSINVSPLVDDKELTAL